MSNSLIERLDEERGHAIEEGKEHSGPPYMMVTVEDYDTLIKVVRAASVETHCRYPTMSHEHIEKSIARAVAVRELEENK